MLYFFQVHVISSGKSGKLDSQWEIEREKKREKNMTKNNDNGWEGACCGIVHTCCNLMMKMGVECVPLHRVSMALKSTASAAAAAVVLCMAIAHFGISFSVVTFVEMTIQRGQTMVPELRKPYFTYSNNNYIICTLKTKKKIFILE